MQLKNSSQIILALITIFGFFFCIFYMLRFGFPPENKDALNALMGVLTTIFTLQMNYFFGSTSSSKAKDDTIAAVAQMPVATPVNIPDAKKVSVDTVSGDITVNPPPKEPTS